MQSPEEKEILCAAKRGDLESVKSLLDSAKINLKNGDVLGAASRNGHLEIVKLLLDRGACIEVKHNFNPLHLAASQGQIEVVKLLVERGAQINLGVSRFETPIYLAALAGDLEMVKVLLELGASFELQSMNSKTPLSGACHEGHLDIVQFLLDRGASIQFNSSRPLWQASSSGHLEIVKLLLDKRAVVDRISQYILEDTELTAACTKGHLDVAKLLVESGANVNKMNSKATNSPLLASAGNGQSEIVNYLLQQGANPVVLNNRGETPLFLACEKGHLVTTQLLLACKGSQDFIDVARTKGETPLIIAANNCHVEVVAALLDHGACIDRQNYEALGFACKSGRPKIVEMFLDKGASVEASCNPLWTACSFSHFDVARLLVERGADVNLASRTGRLPLVTASERGILEIVELLLNNGADVNAVDCEGNTPLIVARTMPVIQKLLKSGANANAANNGGVTPLLTMSGNGLLEGLELICEQGAHINVVSNDGTTPLYCAAEGAHREVVKFLLIRGATVDKRSAHLAALICLCPETVELLLQRRPQLVEEYKDWLVGMTNSDETDSEAGVSLLIKHGYDVNYFDPGYGCTALHLAVDSEFVNKVWELVLHGADTTILDDDKQSVWELYGDNAAIREALLHIWTPATHSRRPKWVKDAIICVLLIAKQQRWPFDQMVLLKILSYVAYGWYKL